MLKPKNLFPKILQFAILLSFLVPTSLFCSDLDSNHVFISQAEIIKNPKLRITTKWKFHPGDNFEWKNENYNDSGWIYSNSELTDKTPNEYDWKGIGWFRLKISLDTSLVNVPLGLGFYQTGTAELYLNGIKLFQTGRITSNPADSHFVFEYPLAISFPNEENIIAVRYSNRNLDIENEIGIFAGFIMEIGDHSKMIKSTSEYLTSMLVKKTIFIVAPLILALLHFFIFIFNRTLTQDLYYTIFLIFFAFYIYFVYSFVYAVSIDTLIVYRELIILGLNFTLLFGSTTIYSIYKPLPRYYILLVFVACIISSIAFINSGSFIWNITYVYLISVSIWGSIPLFDRKQKKEGEKIIKVGFSIMVFAGIYQILMEFELLKPLFGQTDIFTLGVLTFMIFMSISLAYEFTITNKKLINQLDEINSLSKKTLKQELEAKELETQRKILYIENDRKTKELEEARKVQLSMLPDRIPEIDEYDIAVFMKTASEVGGDYYDFNKSLDGTLNVVVGDATGHGMKAGLMVATIKSLFTSIGKNLILTDFFEKCTLTIKEMSLGNLFMSLSFFKFKNDKILFCSAGMPPIFHFVHGKNEINEIIIKSMPLGAVINFPYEMDSIDYNTNDVIVIMSDGLTERFNDKNEMLGKDRIKNIFLESALKMSTSKEIIDELYTLSEKWANGRPLDDDMTLVVIRKI